jgi:hypothetical protein
MVNNFVHPPDHTRFGGWEPLPFLTFNYGWDTLFGLNDLLYFEVLLCI